MDKTVPGTKTDIKVSGRANMIKAGMLASFKDPKMDVEYLESRVTEVDKSDDAGKELGWIKHRENKNKELKWRLNYVRVWNEGLTKNKIVSTTMEKCYPKRFVEYFNRELLE